MRIFHDLSLLLLVSLFTDLLPSPHSSEISMVVIARCENFGGAKETGSDAKEASQGVNARKALVKIWERKVPFLI